MPSLTEALGASVLRAAYCDVTETTRIVVLETRGAARREGGRATP